VTSKKYLPLLILFIHVFSFTAGALVQCSFEDRVIALDPGESGSIEIALFNPDPELIAVRAYLGDWERTKQGEQKFYPPGTFPYSAAEQIQLSDSVLLLGPKEEGKLKLSVQVPEDQRGSRTAILFVEGGQLPEKQLSAQEQFSVRITLRYGIKIYLVARGTEEPKTRITGFSLEALQGQTLPVSLQVENFGNVYLSYRGQLELRSLEGETLQQVELTRFSILPDSTSQIGGEIELPPPGQYLLLAILDWGGETLLAAELPLNVKGGGGR
jgi:P pilus assembly chaperone PapD